MHQSVWSLQITWRLIDTWASASIILIVGFRLMSIKLNNRQFMSGRADVTCPKYTRVLHVLYVALDFCVILSPTQIRGNLSN